MDDFTSTEAYVIIGELYVKYRRAESHVDVLVEQLEECRKESDALTNELEELKTPKAKWRRS